MNITIKKIFFAFFVFFIAHVDGAPNANIQGTVTDATTGLPIVGAVIGAIRGNQVRYSDTTNASGDYALLNIEPSNYNLAVFASGYQNQIVGVKPPNNQTTIVNFQLTPLGGTIAGTVIDANTLLPIAGATVIIFSGVDFITATTTDGSGAYSVPNLAPNNYIVLVRATNYRAQFQGATVQAGMTTIVNFALIAPPGTIAGTVTDALTTNPIAGALVEVFDGTTKVGFADTDINGNYTIDDLAPGDYTVVVSATGYRAQLSGAIVNANATTTVDFALLPNPGSVAGQVTNAQTGTGIAGASILVLQNGSIVTSILTDSNGNYSIDGLAPGEYTLVANAHNFNTAIRGVSISSNTTSIVNFALTQVPGTIAGTVIDAGTLLPIAGASVRVFQNTILIAIAITDSNGNYQIPDLAPGSYTVVASAANFRTQAHQAIVTSNTTTTINFALVTNPGTIAGTVTDAATTNPIVDASIIVLQGQMVMGSAVTDSNGDYQIPDLAPGNYFVIARANGYQTAFSIAVVTAGATTIVDFALTTTFGSLEGIITQLCTQDPISGVVVLVTNADQVIIGVGVTDDNGTYSISNLASGLYSVSAINPNYVTKTRTAEIVSPATTTLNFVLTSIIPPNPAPPPTISGFIIRNRYLTQTDFIHEIAWGKSPDNCITDYLIFRNGQLIAHVLPNEQLKFTDFNYATRAAEYSVKAVNSLGAVSEPATIIFH